MPGESIDYHALVQQALRDVVRQALRQTATHGLPGAHHFYIGFRTGEPGVVLPPVLRRQYPDEMTIVLENQFWGLEVEDHAFSVTLRFDGVPRRLTVPFAAITRFVDPAVSFGLRFGLAADADASTAARQGNVVPFGPSRKE